MDHMMLVQLHQHYLGQQAQDYYHLAERFKLFFLLTQRKREYNVT
jgi:hypothetical protein